MLGSLWQFGKIAKDFQLMTKVESRAGVIKDRLEQVLSGGPLPGSPRSQRGAIGYLNPTKAEKKYFDEIFASEVDAQELLEAAPSARMEDGKFVVDPKDFEGFTEYMDTTMALRDQGSRLPPSFYNDNFLLRLEAGGSK